MPDDLRSLRYPKLFAMQAQVLSVYHMLDPQMFYNRGCGQIHEIYRRGSTRLHYAIMSLRAEGEEFLLLQPLRR